ncbi:MAG: transglycosylase domain-containing protein [Flavobacteriaceae bacterium]
MKKTRKKKIFLALKITAALLVVLMVLAIVFRDSLLQEAIAHISKKMAREYDSQFSVKHAEFSGLTGVSMQDIVLKPKHSDTLLSMAEVKADVSLWHLFLGDIQLTQLDARNGYLQLIKNQNGWNFKSFLPKKDTIDDGEKTNYAKLAYKLLNKGLNLVPTDLKLNNLSLRVNDQGKSATMRLNQMVLADKQLESSIEVHTNTFSQRWKIKGFADPRNKQTDLRFFNLDTGKIKVPYFDERYNLKSSFDSIRLKVTEIEMDNGELHINGSSSVRNLTVNHTKIASKDVVIKNARLDYRFVLGENFIALDSSSTATLNKIKCHPYVSYDNEFDKIYTLKVKIPKMSAQNFITSLPEGLFTHFQGMEVTGNFDYRLNLAINKDHPNKTLFDSEFNKENLEILKYGEANLTKLNGPFMYHAIINGVEQRGVMVGPSNPNYTPLSEISPYLRKCVLTTEDPSFFSHKGFIKEAFKQSIVKNIRTRKFSRGGSTISMQLIKNAFLTREKTLSRKLEEILLVYIMENNHIVSKERMLEVYFNIIEWGPNVYGIGEAAHYYFQKHPSQLTLNECLYLANIIPSPRRFMYQFNTEGNLRSFATNRDDQLIGLMMRRGLITSEDTINRLPIMVSGPARSLIKIRVDNPTEADTISTIEEFDF